ncbi:MAG: hypothetical protein R6X09_00460 [Bacteroidales bacterium]
MKDKVPKILKEKESGTIEQIQVPRLDNTSLLRPKCYPFCSSGWHDINRDIYALGLLAIAFTWLAINRYRKTA